MLLQQAAEGREHAISRVVAEAVVDALEVVEVDQDDAETTSELLRPLDLRVEHLQEAPPVDEARQVVGDRLALNQIVQARVLERDSGLRREPFRELPRLGREALRRRVEDELGTSCFILGREIEP